ncbi:MAG: YceI family protein [Gammaproteobacteria bacterium]|jgi:polyisoprenoid-binding protein YceI|nr:YceI family protein [Gammaproteobacteria bacterium]
MIKRFAITALVLSLTTVAQASENNATGVEHYAIDTRGAHAFVQFRIPHLGFSWLYGRFNEFDGHFTFDPDNPENSEVEVTIQTASVDSNHERRDNHLRNEDFLDVDEHPEAHFRSTGFRHIKGDRYELTGDFTLRGQTRPVEIEVEHIGAGEDPWGGYRRGFSGRTSFALADFGIDYDLGPDSRVVEIILDIEGIRQDGG